MCPFVVEDALAAEVGQRCERGPFLVARRMLRKAASPFEIRSNCLVSGGFLPRQSFVLRAKSRVRQETGKE